MYNTRHKDVKIRVHHLSHYHIRLTYQDTEKSSVTLRLILLNYKDPPITGGSLVQTTFNILLTPFQTIRDNRCACGTNTNSRDLSSNHNFITVFNRLEKLVDEIIKIGVEIKKVKKDIDDKILRRRNVKALKKTRYSVEDKLIVIVKEILKI
jgi:hypothetical protein